MTLKKTFLQNFRSYQKSEFSFEETTLIVGPNTSGKTNLIESVYLLSSGKSFRTEKDAQMLKFNEEIGKVKGLVDDWQLEVVITNGIYNGKSQYKKFLVNGVSKRRVDFAGNLLSVLFSPQDLDIIVDSPSLRRNFLDEVLEQVDRSYRIALISYSKAIRQRNALLESTRENGVRNDKQFEYWDSIVIENGQIISQKREEFINFANSKSKDIFDFALIYDKSEISAQRLLQYRQEEVLSGVTLVGPHRDDFSVFMFDPPAGGNKTMHDIKYFGSRGQQRLTILQLKLLELLFVEEKMGKRPVLILDDIFSELDAEHINLIFDQIGKQQTIMTTTHKEFIPKKLLNKMKVINFNK
jgi:DNA replication and repair protein RecF